MRTSWNVESIERIDGRALQYKGHIVVPLTSFGAPHDSMPGGGWERDGVSQGGIVFANSEVAVELMQALETYFEGHKITLRGEVVGWFYDTCHRLWLKLKYSKGVQRWKQQLIMRRLKISSSV